MTMLTALLLLLSGCAAFPSRAAHHPSALGARRASSPADYCVYLLVNSANNCTYVGSTNNSARRLRQHNGELAGGARYTAMKRQLGSWAYFGSVGGLERRLALSVEKRVQLRSRRSTGKTPLLRRLCAIEQVLAMVEQEGGRRLVFCTGAPPAPEK